MENYAIKLFQKYAHSIVFSIIGLFIAGWPLASARWYLTYLIGLVFVWTLPSNKKYQMFGYIVLIIGTAAKGYVEYISPKINTKIIPIAMYEGDFIQSNNEISANLKKCLSERFSEDIDLALQTTKITAPKITEMHDFGHSKKPFLYDVTANSKLLDLANLWGLPPIVRNAPSFILKITIEKSNKEKIWFHDWKNNTFFEEDQHHNIKTHVKPNSRIELKEGHSFYLPFIAYPQPSWVYIELEPLAVYIPLLLLLAAFLLANVKDVNAKFLEHMTCFVIAFIVICLADNWPNYNESYINLYPIGNWIFDGAWGAQASQTPVWYIANQMFYYIGSFGYLFPILCFWASSWCILQILRELFSEDYVYIAWGIILTTPWLARNGMGLQAYHQWYVLYNSLMLGMPLFLFGMIGYMRTFNAMHGIAWIAASLCNVVILFGVTCLLIHKHLGRHRFIYLAITLILFALANIQHFNNFMHPMKIADLLYTIKLGYKPIFIIMGLVPNTLLAFSKNLTHRRFARASLLMHGGFLASTLVYQEAYLACTLSWICGLIYAEKFVRKIKPSFKPILAQ